VLIKQQGATARAAMEDVDTGRVATFNVDDLVETVAEAKADDNRRRRGDPPPLTPFARRRHVVKKRFIACESLARVFG
jgi:hypothetical protein